MGSLQKVLSGRNGVHEFAWWYTESSGSPGEGAHLGAWPCIGASWGALGCNGIDGSARGTQGKGASLEKLWGVGLLSMVVVGCSGVQWGARGHSGMSWSLVAMRGEHLGTAELMIPTPGLTPSTGSCATCRETTKPHWSLVCPQYQQRTSKVREAQTAV